MRQFRAIAARVANSTAFLFRTGSAPGMPRQTGQTFVFGEAPNRVEHEQKIFVAVSSWTCTSSPITGSNFGWAAIEVSAVVAIEETIIKGILHWGESERTEAGPLQCSFVSPVVNILRDSSLGVLRSVQIVVHR